MKSRLLGLRGLHDLLVVGKICGRDTQGRGEHVTLTLPRIWLNFFSPTTLRTAMTAGVKGPKAACFPMRKPVIFALDSRCMVDEASKAG